jgi:hypothetical protein
MDLHDLNDKAVRRSLRSPQKNVGRQNVGEGLAGDDAVGPLSNHSQLGILRQTSTSGWLSSGATTGKALSGSRLST